MGMDDSNIGPFPFIYSKMTSLYLVIAQVLFVPLSSDSQEISMSGNFLALESAASLLRVP